MIDPPTIAELIAACERLRLAVNEADGIGQANDRQQIPDLEAQRTADEAENAAMRDVVRVAERLTPVTSKTGDARTLTDGRVGELANPDTPWHRWSSVVEVRSLATELLSFRSSKRTDDTERDQLRAEVERLSRETERLADEDTERYRLRDDNVGLRAEVERLNQESAKWYKAGADGIDTALEHGVRERDAALQRVSQLESGLREAVRNLAGCRPPFAMLDDWHVIIDRLSKLAG